MARFFEYDVRSSANPKNCLDSHANSAVTYADDEVLSAPALKGIALTNIATKQERRYSMTTKIGSSRKSI